jgi:tetratricopeptide (TPR) repeat protein
VVAYGLSAGKAILPGRSKRRAVVLGAAAIAGLVGAPFLILKAQNSLAASRAAQAARAAIASGHHREARKPLAQWLRATPDSAEAHALAAQVELEEGDLGKVTDELNHARSLGYPKDGLERLHAVTLARIGRFAEAEPILVRLYQTESKPDPAVEEALARLYLMTYRLRQAEEVIHRWIRDAPSDARPFLWLTEYDRRMEVDNSEALEAHYRAALDRDQNLDPARLGLAETLRKAHRNAEAAPEYEIYLARHDSDSAALSGAGLNDLALGDLESAARRLDRALELDGRDSGALKGRAEIDTARREPKKALERLDRALEIDPFDTEALYTRGRIRAVLGDTTRAKADLDSFKRYTNDHAELLKIRGLLMTDPNNNALRCKVAAWMLAHGREADGLGWAKAVLASAPDHAETNSLLAGYYSTRPNEAGLANFYRLRVSPSRSTPQ